MTMESLAVNGRASLLLHNPKAAPTAQENPCQGTIKATTTPSADNVANGLLNEPLNFSPTDDGNNIIFQPETQDVGLQMLVTTGLQGNLRLPKHVCGDHHIKFRH
ncbi:hypothetical protein ACH5RR_015734 [Cinchona calisaya]|uniref:Uncharacterized protein n=1 Tax=Cinchona calisaya TaxID=153742 RepID=A0ABD2ZXE6_9GENT